LTSSSTISRQETINKAAAYLDLDPDTIRAVALIYAAEIRQALYRSILDRKQSKNLNYVWAVVKSSNKENSMEMNSLVRSIASSMNLATRLIPDVIGKKRFGQCLELTKSIDPPKSSALFKLIFTDCYRQFMIERTDLELNYGSLLRFVLYLLFSGLSLLLLAFIFA